MTLIKDFGALSVPEELTELTAQEYKMSIRLQSDGLFLACCFTKQLQTVFFRFQPFSSEKTYPEQVKDCFFKYSWLSYPFKETKILVSTPIHTIIPNELYDLAHKDQLLQSVFYEKVGHVIAEKLNFMDGTLLFSIDDELFQFLSRSFNAPSFVFSSSALMKNAINKDEKTNLTTLYIQNYRDFLHLFSVVDKKISFTNSYPIKHIHDAFYVSMATWKYLHLTQKDKVRLIGDINFVNSLQTLMQIYIKDVKEFDIPREYFLLSEEIANVPADLIFQILCE